MRMKMRMRKDNALALSCHHSHSVSHSHSDFRTVLDGKISDPSRGRTFEQMGGPVWAGIIN
jgi:hypothetical protein